VLDAHADYCAVGYSPSNPNVSRTRWAPPEMIRGIERTL
jgi:hypothetical protein